MIINNKTKAPIFLLALMLVGIPYGCTPKAVSTEERFTATETSTSATIVVQKEEFFEEEATLYKNLIYYDKIKTVLLYKKGWEISDPVIRLNSEETLELRFDEIDGDITAYQYKIIHCNADWTQSSLTSMDYINGFEENYIENNKYSFNSYQSFVHYWMEFPNENIQLTKSGNYIISVYPEGKDQYPVLTQKFYVTENSMRIVPKIKYPANLDYKYYRQEVDFTLSYDKMEVINPYSNIKVHIEQNHRTDNSCTELIPNFVKEDQLIYNYEDENVFDGGNEFRLIDISTLKNYTQRVLSIDNRNNSYRVKLKPDIKRTYKKYLEAGDANGRLFIKNIDGYDHNLESDYAYTTFTIPYSHPLNKGDLYIYGQLTGWEIDNAYRLKYDYDALAYKAEIYLKQGVYNYAYLYVSDTAKSADISLIEGTHFDTENEYIFKVYYKDPGGFYDRLLLYYTANSRDNF